MNENLERHDKLQALSQGHPFGKAEQVRMRFRLWHSLPLTQNYQTGSDTGRI